MGAQHLADKQRRRVLDQNPAAQTKLEKKIKKGRAFASSTHNESWQSTGAEGPLWIFFLWNFLNSEKKNPRPPPTSGPEQSTAPPPRIGARSPTLARAVDAPLDSPSAPRVQSACCPPPLREIATEGEKPPYDDGVGASPGLQAC